MVECLYACREGLDFGDLETLGSGMKVKTGRTLSFKWVNSFPGFHMNCFTIRIIRHATTRNI